MAINENSCMERRQRPYHLPTPGADNEDPQGPKNTTHANINEYSTHTQPQHPNTFYIASLRQLGFDKAKICSGIIKITKQFIHWLKLTADVCQNGTLELIASRKGKDSQPSQLTLTCFSYPHYPSIWGSKITQLHVERCLQHSYTAMYANRMKKQHQKQADSTSRLTTASKIITFEENFFLAQSQQTWILCD